MSKRIVGLIGNGQGPVVHVEGRCTAIVEGLRQGGVVTLSIDGKDPIVFEENCETPLGDRPKRLFFSAEHASLELICRIRMEV